PRQTRRDHQSGTSTGDCPNESRSPRAHVACLRDCGLVEGRAVGRQMLYRLTHPQLLTLLGSAEELLAATGNAVDLCPVYGHGEQELSA
ncbi:ArsR/SmtB family transcription factor, partial [Dactylosporangium salmoneum]|uniref:ArsR/SmtB family transcription factor n=1 Tax=Dactylosporangium salmoneum TaxID=53361 RepID=UPI003CD0A0ED